VNVYSLFFASMQNGMLNFALGSTHILLENHYNQQLVLLIAIESIYIILLAISLKSCKIHKKKIHVWQNVMASSLRICLIFSFYLDFELLTTTKNLFNDLQINIMILYLINWVLSILTSYILLLFDVFRYLMKE
jgi:hypothetical protein